MCFVYNMQVEKGEMYSVTDVKNPRITFSVDSDQKGDAIEKAQVSVAGKTFPWMIC